VKAQQPSWLAPLVLPSPPFPYCSSLNAHPSFTLDGDKTPADPPWMRRAIVDTCRTEIPMTTTVDVPAGVHVPLDRISADSESQARVQIRASVVRQYAAAMSEQLAEGGLRFPPIVLFTDERDYWIGDGFHRVLAARQAGLTEFPADVRPGSRRDALLHSISSNSAHGLPRTNADKRRAVSLLLADPEWGEWSDREIARRCQVGNTFVSTMRRASVRGRKVQRGNQVYEMAPPAANPASKQLPENPVPTDALGLPVPEPRIPVFAAQGDFQEANALFDRLATVVDRIARSPAGDLYRPELVRTLSEGAPTLVCPALRIARGKLFAIEPYCAYCPNCFEPHPGLVHPACKSCGGRGWTTRPAFHACPEDARKRLSKLAAPEQ
jgi:ParB-like nuclease domain